MFLFWKEKLTQQQSPLQIQSNLWIKATQGKDSTWFLKTSGLYLEVALFYFINERLFKSGLSLQSGLFRRRPLLLVWLYCVLLAGWCCHGNIEREGELSFFCSSTITTNSVSRGERGESTECYHRTWSSTLCWYKGISEVNSYPAGTNND